jgi:hypothetical protein
MEIIIDSVAQLGMDDNHGKAEHTGDCVNRMPIMFSLRRAGRCRMQGREGFLPDQ